MTHRFIVVPLAAAAVAFVTATGAAAQSSIDCGGRRWAVDNLGLRLTNAEGSWEYWAFGPGGRRSINARLANGRSVVLYAFGVSRQRFEEGFGRPADYGMFAMCASTVGRGIYQGRGWWPIYVLVPAENEPWMEGQDVALTLSTDPDWSSRRGARIDGWLRTLPGDDLIRFGGELLVMPDATPGTASPLFGPNAPNPQTLSGLARTIAEDFAARAIARLDSVSPTLDDFIVTFTVRARSADGTRHTLTYSGPTLSSPPPAPF